MRNSLYNRLVGIVCLLVLLQSASAQDSFVRINNGLFQREGRPYYYVGTNYWYGGLLALTASGQQRVKEELDFLKASGVKNLRVLAAVEGSGNINGNPRVEPAYQYAAGQFRDELLTGLDFLLAEMGKRNMTAVVLLSNNWEWSGGFLQYLNWNGLLSDSLLRNKMEWEDMRDYISRFYSCEPCIKQYSTQITRIISRINTVTGKKYSDDPAIMSWEIANEPRPMRAAAIKAYMNFIHATALQIRSLDRNHLITTGSEGYIGSESVKVFRTVHGDKAIDYLTIHIWPKNWGWFSGTSLAAQFSQVLKKTRNYIRKHQVLATKMNKPLVLEEFGLPRDGLSFSLSAATTFRDRYYRFVFSFLLKDARSGGPVAGADFWAFGGKGRPSGKQPMWQRGDDWLGDPPMEEQGLNTVFDQDKSTWEIITAVAASLSGMQSQY